jgi:hypothetical protein
MPRIIEDHSDIIAARANADLRARGVDDLRFDTPVFRSRRAMAETALTIEAALTTPEAAAAPAAGPIPAEAMRTRLAAVLRSPQARGKADAALALALRTDMSTDQITTTLRGLPEGADLGLPPRAIADPEAKAEADRIRQIVTADAAAGHHDHALALALDTDITAAAALAILGAMPQPKRIASIEERAREMAEFGPSDFSMEETHGDRTASGWSKAVAKANARLEAAAPTSATEPQAPGGPRFGADQ